jgi:hypothetical protein
MAKASEAVKVVTNEVRLSYVHLFEPYSNDPDKDKSYSCVLLIPKSDKVTMRKLRAAQQAALEDGKAKFGGKVPKTWKDTIHDGDEEADLDTNPEYEGNYYMTVSAKAAYPPGVVDRRLNQIIDSTEVYSGCYARVSLAAFAFNTQGNKGVSFGLRNVQKLRDGEPLGGRSKAEDDFDELDDDDEDDVL